MASKSKKEKPAKSEEKAGPSFHGQPIQLDEKSEFIAVMEVSNEIIVASIAEFKGKRGIDIRRYYDSDGTWRPSGKGFRVPVELAADMGTFLSEVTERIVNE